MAHAMRSAWNAHRHWLHSSPVLMQLPPTVGALVPRGFGVDAKLEGATLELQDAHEDAKKITEMAESLEAAVGERADVRGEANAEQVEGIDGAAGVAKAEDIHTPLAAREESFDGRFGALVGEIAQKRIARAHGKEAKFDAIGFPFTRENAVDDFVRGAVAADGKEAAIALVVGFAGELHGVARSHGGDRVHAQPFRLKAAEFGSGELCGASTARRRIDDG